MNSLRNTIIVGGGQAGLATSSFLARQGVDHVVLEKAPYAGSAWRDQRWDSFCLLTPNWTFLLPGAEYQGDSPEGFMPRAEVVARLEEYVTANHLPIQYGARVTCVEANGAGGGFRVRTAEGDLDAANVVIATGLYQGPKRPFFASGLSPHILQLHSSEYRNPAQLPPGAVLVVGSGQSGCQIAEELYESGRRVYLALGTAGRAPRRYRGRDTFTWLMQSGFMDRPPEALPSPQARFAANPQVSGKDGGRTLNLHKFARDGVVLVGRVSGGEGQTLQIAPNRNEMLAKNDAFERTIVTLIDAFIARSGISAPEESLPEWRDGYAGDEISELDLGALGIDTILWASGYAFDFSLVRFPVFDAAGYPVQRRGATDVPGLYFVGLPWLSKYKSGLFAGIGEDAAFIADAIAARSL